MRQTSVRWGRRAFLIELLFAMIALGLCAAICLAGFVRADSISGQSRDLTEAVIRAQSAAEQFKENPASYIERQIEARPLAFYDHKWNDSAASVADGFLLEVSCTDQDGMLSAVFTVRPTGDSAAIFTLTAHKYLPPEKRRAG